MVIKAVKGVKDIIPKDIAKWRWVEDSAREVFARYGYREIVLPIFEKSEVFVKSVGETTDIVQKEMYSFLDKGGDSLTLRPEGTASCVRAYIEHSMYHPQGTVTPLFYIGPMFRRERPQAGRFRQFHQIGAELFGTDNPTADAEVMHLLMTFLKTVGARKPKLLLNSLGDDKCRPAFRRSLVEFLAGRKDALCPLCKERYETNPLRVLDCKSETCAETVRDAPTIDRFWCDDCADHFQKVRKALYGLNLEYEINHRMVRGLDYYSRTVFEVTASGLGAKDAVAAGGRYDALVKKSGGPDVPAIGWAVGMERLIESIGDSAGEKTNDTAPDICIIHLGEGALGEAFRLAGLLRERGRKVLCPYRQTGMKKQMGRADKSGAKLAVIIGEEEFQKKTALVKNLSTGEQSEHPIDDITKIAAEPPA
jgi:histidyl-tRNA synthetase